jgi:hypothetical protein
VVIRGELMTRKKDCDRLKIDGKTYYAYGAFRPDATQNIEHYASRIRKEGGKARVVKKKSCTMVYANNPKYV